MNFFEYERRMYNGETTVMDDSPEDVNTEIARQNAEKAEHGTEKSAKQIAEFSDKGKVLSAEELLEHRKHCRAKPGNCPFEKAVDEADNITPNEIKVTKQTVYNRLAAMLTNLFQTAKNLAKPAIANQEKVEEEVEVKETVAQDKYTIYAPVVDESPKTVQDEEEENTNESHAQNSDDTNTDAKIVAEILEGGIEKMVELAKSKGCAVNMDENGEKYIVRGPER